MSANFAELDRGRPESTTARLEPPRQAHGLLGALSSVVADGEWPGSPLFLPADPATSQSVVTIAELIHSLCYHQPRHNQLPLAKNGRPVDPCGYGGRTAGLTHAESSPCYSVAVSIHGRG